MRTNNYKPFLEFVALICLFLAIGADWNTLGGKVMPHEQTNLFILEQNEGTEARRRAEILAREIHRLSFEVNLKGLANTDSDFSPRLMSYSLRIEPVNTTSHQACFDFLFFFDHIEEFWRPDNSFQEVFFTLETAKHLLEQLLISNRQILQEVAA